MSRTELTIILLSLLVFSMAQSPAFAVSHDSILKDTAIKHFSVQNMTAPTEAPTLIAKNDDPPPHRRADDPPPTRRGDDPPPHR